MSRAQFILLFFLGSFPAFSETYQGWCDSWFSSQQRTDGLASPLADPDRDGSVNLQEYLSNSSPLDAANRLTATMAMSPTETATVIYPLDPSASQAFASCEVSNDLIHWWDHSVLVHTTPDTCYDLNGYQFARLVIAPSPGAFLDSDGDGLDDFFEEMLIAASSTDAHHTLADILPGDDFDSDLTPNIDEVENAPARSGQDKPPFLAPEAVTASIDASSPAPPTVLLVHTPLR